MIITSYIFDPLNSKRRHLLKVKGLLSKNLLIEKNLFIFNYEIIMIQSKKNQRNGLQIMIEQICEESLGYFTKALPLSRSNFPIMELTYTLWRKYTYERVLKSVKQSEKEKKQITKIFHSISEKIYLPNFVKRLETQMNIYCRGLQSVEENLKQFQKIPQKQQEIYKLIIELGKSVWLQQLYLQLLEDLINLPYIEVTSRNSVFNPKHEYKTDYAFRKQKQTKIKKLANKAGKSIFNKLLAVITETLFSKALILKINTLFGTFNPVLIGASFGLSSYLEHLDQKKKDEELEVQLKKALHYGYQKFDKIKQIYNKCLVEIEKIVTTQCYNEEKTSKKSLNQLFLIIFEEEWLKIEVKLDSDGWQAVTLEEKQSFQDLSQ